MIICPFCGKESQSEDHCSKCFAQFNKEIRAIAYTPENDPRSDYIGPFKNKTALRLLLAAMIVLIIAFVVITEVVT